MNDIPLSTWANLAEIIGAGSIITGLIIGWFQIRQFRVQQQQPSWGEWFEWLGDQAIKAKKPSPPAQIAHKDWKP